MTHSLRPRLIPAAEAHRSGEISYDSEGNARLQSAGLSIPPARQYPAIRATFDDLNKALSTQANSPRVSGTSLRARYEAEAERYEALVAEALAEDKLEPDYGTYVYDASRQDLYLVAPEPWHRLALVTSNSKLLTDPAQELSWQDIRERLESAVVGFAGVSVGGNLLEGWLREARPKCVKLADPDWVELTNFNRGERMSLRHLVAPRSARFDQKNPYDVPRIPKAEYAAYEAQLVDPYLEVHVYSEGLNRENLDRFFLGDGAGEPPIDILVEEMDHLELKVLVRQEARKHRVDVLMLSDFGHQAHVFWNPFRTEPDSRLGYASSDDLLLEALAKARGGDRAKIFEFVALLCGEDFAGDQFRAWIEGRGEQPTSSLPQSGATAMASGAIGGKEIALRVLGYPVPAGRRVVYDLLHRRATQG
jgi:hypothetical protein